MAPCLRARVCSAGAVGSPGGILLSPQRLTAGPQSATQCCRTILISSNRSASLHTQSGDQWCHSNKQSSHSFPSPPEALLSKLEWKASSSPPPPLLHLHLHHPLPVRPMALNSNNTTYSTISSPLSTPRSQSPASIFSGRASHTSTISTSKRMSISSRRSLSQFNPMSSVNTQAIQERMKMASLDGLRGYAQNHYGEVQQYVKTEYVPKSQATGFQILREPSWNKGNQQNSIPNSRRPAGCRHWSIIC